MDEGEADMISNVAEMRVIIGDKDSEERAEELRIQVPKRPPQNGKGTIPVGGERY
jgi:hypothetical protein